MFTVQLALKVKILFWFCFIKQDDYNNGIKQEERENIIKRYKENKQTIHFNY